MSQRALTFALEGAFVATILVLPLYALPVYLLPWTYAVMAGVAIALLVHHCTKNEKLPPLDVGPKQ